MQTSMATAVPARRAITLGSRPSDSSTVCFGVMAEPEKYIRLYVKNKLLHNKGHSILKTDKPDF